jgi:hypothetical protein
MLNAVYEKFTGMQNDLLCLNDLLRKNENVGPVSGILEKAKRLFIPSYAKAEIQGIADKILKDVKNPETRHTSFRLADAFTRYFETSLYGEQISKVFDRAIASYRPEYHFLHKENQIKFDKWKRSGQDALIYQNHPEFSSFMENSGIVSQMKVTRDTFKEIDGEPAITVNGEWMTWPVFKEKFKYVYSERFRETFVIGKDNQVYTYLDNGKGLQLHHPYLTETTPTSLLSHTDFNKVLEKARLFVRAGEELLSAEQRAELNEKRTFVVQVVTSYANKGSSRLHDIIVNPQHPYLRLIIGEDKPDLKLAKGEVYEVGFNRKLPIAVPLMTTEGRFRSPDINEYLQFEEKIVTNIALTKEEAQTFANYVTEYHRSEVNIGNPIGFHNLSQNCCSFIRCALESANVKIPTEITLAELWPKAMPEWALQAGAAAKSLALKTFAIIKNPAKYLPECLKSPMRKTAKKVTEKFRELLDFMTAVVFIPLKIALGEAFGSGGRAFVKFGDKPKTIGPNMKRLKGWFMLSNYTINLPGIVQRWQREQASTVIYKDAIKLCIVP